MTSSFVDEGLLTWQLLDLLADNDAALHGYVLTRPMFAVYRSSNQTIPAGTDEKVNCNTEELDSNSNYDNVTNFRFTPTVAGKYLFAAAAVLNGVSEGLWTALKLFKNGVHRRTFQESTSGKGAAGVGTAVTGLAGSVIETANGSTDYFELYIFQNESISLTMTGAQKSTYWGGVLVMAR